MANVLACSSSFQHPAAPRLKIFMKDARKSKYVLSRHDDNLLRSIIKLIEIIIGLEDIIISKGDALLLSVISGMPAELLLALYKLHRAWAF